MLVIVNTNLMMHIIIKNNDVVRGKNSLRGGSAVLLMHKENLPLSAYISMERIVYAE